MSTGSELAASLLVNGIWQATVMAFLVAVLARVGRRLPPDRRASLWLAGLLITAALPPLAVLQPAIATSTDSSAALVIRADALVTTSSPAGVPLLPLGVAALIVGRLLYLAAGMWRLRSLRSNRRIVLSDRVAAPMTFGVRRPVIALPARMWRDAERELRAAILAHEQAHIRRGDYFWNLLVEVATLAIWWHPAVWWMKARWSKEREFACDAAAARRVPRYAAQLLSAAGRIAEPSPRLSLGLFDSNAFEERMMKLVDRTIPLGRRAARTLQFVSLASLLAGALFLGGRPVAFAEEESPVYKISDGGVSPPRLVVKREPDYTQEARDAHIEGIVVLSVIISDKGVAERVSVKRGLDAGLDQKAIEAISQWKFEPAKKDGKPVRVAATIEVNFRLL